MKRLVIFLLFAVSTYGQVPVTVTGLITDAGNNPATSGFVQFDIVPKASSIHYFISGIGTITQTVQCGINGSGLVKSQLNLANPCTVWGNDLINPANTQYKVTFAPNGVVTNIVSGECITGSSYSLNNPVFCPQIALTPQIITIRSNPFQVNIIPSAGGVFNIGSPLLPYAAVYANNFFVNGVLFNASNVAFLNLPNVFTQTNTFPAVKSSTANSAASGFLRLASIDSINWRNNANSGDLSISKNVGDSLLLNTFPSVIGAQFLASSYTGTNANQAAAGLYRLASADSINWRNNANSADLSLSKNASDNLVWNGSKFCFTAGGFNLCLVGTPSGANNDVTIANASGTVLTTGTFNPGIHIARTAGCATAAAQFSICDTAVTWTNPFADANYTVTCLGGATTSGVPIVQSQGTAAKTAAAISVRTIALTAAIAQFTLVECVAIHD